MGSLDPEVVVTPGIFVDRVVRTTTHLDTGLTVDDVKAATAARLREGKIR